MGVHFQLPPPHLWYDNAPKPYSPPPIAHFQPPAPTYVEPKPYNYHDFRDPGQELGDILPELFSYEASCPVEVDAHGCVDRWVNLYQMIQHLNDEHRWTREAIADWLETLPVDLTFKRGDTDVEDPGDQGG